jgi:hypothetical protein
MESVPENPVVKKGMSLYRLQKETGIPYASLHAFYSSQEKLLACSSSTLYGIAQTLDVPLEAFFQDDCLRIPGRFAYCFWDSGLKNLMQENAPFVIARLYERGGVDGLHYAESHFTREQIIQAAATRRDFSPVTANFLRQRYGLAKTQMAYYRYGGGKDWRKNDR